MTEEQLDRIMAFYGLETTEELDEMLGRPGDWSGRGTGKPAGPDRTPGS